jgi:putative DNA primase/helicase
MSALGTANAARGRWPAILHALGIDPAFLKDQHGPCPACGGHDRFRFDDKLNGSWFCNQCGSGDGISLLQKVHGWPVRKALDEVDRVVGHCPTTPDAKPERTLAEKRDTLIRLWKGARPVTEGDPVWLYLNRRCGDPSAFLGQIRFHPGLKHSVDRQTHPGMVALLQPNEGRAVGVHRTFLTPDGMKADVDPVRMVFGDCAQVQLCPPSERMGVGEGIETCICASKRFGIPVWSAMNANGLKAWEPPPIARSIVIFGDNDANYTGQEAAFCLARKLAMKGLRVEVRIPDAVGSDWADVQMQEVA